MSKHVSNIKGKGLERSTLEVSRVMEFFSEKELTMQIGHGRENWPVALLKELIDNGLDACEMANIPPQVEVEIGESDFSVRDNGPGLPKKTLIRSLDFLTRVSDKSHYVSPTRGQLGNALKTIWAAPFVAHGEGYVEVWTQGVHHTIKVSADKIAQKPKVEHSKEQDDLVKNGTFIKIHWADLACSEPIKNDDSYNEPVEPFPVAARKLVERYAAFNPHATFRLGDKTYEATAPHWEKWRPNDHTSPHWYTPETLRDLIAAYVSDEQDGGKLRTVREFVSEFRGLLSTTKQKEAKGEFGGMYLHDLVKGDDIDLGSVETLLEAMKKLSKPPKPSILGVIGEDHLKAWAIRYAGVTEQSFRYKKKLGFDGLPYVLEIAFGVRKEGQRIVLTGLNWSPTLVHPVGELDRMLGQMRMDSSDPLTVILHIARPRFEFVDRGKTRLELADDLKDDLIRALTSIGRDWKKAKRMEDKAGNISQNRLDRMRYRPARVTIKDVAFRVMESAYLKASGNGRYPTTSRQVYYAARPEILRETGESELDSQYFCQTLLKDYMERYQPSWDVVYDARGHITEPHTGETVGLGGLEVRDYIGRFTNGQFDETPPPVINERISTTGPDLRYGAVLFIEKEGFDSLLEHAKIAERYDIAIASTKGMPVTASCDLLGKLKEQNRKVFVLHDFDKSGFSILATLRHGTRGSHGTGDVVDLGLRLEDIEGLEREKVSYSSDPCWNLEQNGATKEEIEILYRGGRSGERVELNAMTSDQFIQWLERKLKEHGIKKLIPDRQALAAAYRRAIFLQKMKKEEKKLRKKIAGQAISVPANLDKKVQRKLKDTPELSWDEVVWQLAENGND